MTNLPDRTELRGFFAAAQREPSLVEHAYLSGNLKSRDEMDIQTPVRITGMRDDIIEHIADMLWGVTDD